MSVVSGLTVKKYIILDPLPYINTTHMTEFYLYCWDRRERRGRVRGGRAGW